MQCSILCALISIWLTNHGYNPPQHDAALQNIHLESRFDPCVGRGKNGSAYLFQWLGPRRRALEKFAQTVQCPDWKTQLEFATWELQAPKYHKFWATTDPRIALHELRERFGRGK